ncbi:hypothetical protein HDU67_001512 [Dinochytrium kinnereticum]|nr:hypothetical protein HDU67_001512 [Dinochytrium kinnereticum]
MGGVFLDSEHWVSDCTHLLAEAITRTEKCLAAMASGAWILKPSYLESSEQAGGFAEEERWEWSPLDDTGAFKGWKVLLILDQKKASGLARVLKAGLAEVEMMPKSRAARLDMSEVVQFNHCVVESSPEKTPLAKTLRNADVKILSTNFLFEFFMEPLL